MDYWAALVKAVIDHFGRAHYLEAVEALVVFVKVLQILNVRIDFYVELKLSSIDVIHKHLVHIKVVVLLVNHRDKI